MSLGENIKLFRKQLKLSQDGLASKSGLSRNAIYNYESNNRQPSIEILSKIAVALEVPVSKLITDSSKENPQYYFIEQYIKSLGYEIDGDESEGYLVINTPDNETYEISEKDIEELGTTTKSFVQFKLQDIIKNSRKIGK